MQETRTLKSYYQVNLVFYLNLNKLNNKGEIKMKNEIRVFKMNEYVWYASKWSSEETNDWYNKNVEDNDIEDVELVDLDSEGMWYETNDKEDIERLGDSDELRKVVLGEAEFGDLLRKGNSVYKYISYREAIKQDLYFTEPYCISTTEW